MWWNTHGVKERGASNTLRSPGVALVIGGNLAEVQQRPVFDAGAETKPFIFSSPQVIKGGQYRCKSQNYAGLSNRYDRPMTAKSVAFDSKKLVPERYSKDLNRSTYMDSYTDPKTRRPWSAVPSDTKYSFAYIKDKNHVETPLKSLYKEYSAQKTNSKRPVSQVCKNQEKSIEEAHIEQEQIALEKDAKELQRQEKLVEIPPPDLVDDYSPQTPEKQIEVVSKEDVLTPEKFDNIKEIKLRRDLRWKYLAEKKLRGRIDMELSTNYSQQKKLNSKINKLKDQQRERDLSYHAAQKVKKDLIEREAHKRQYGRFAKKDLTEYISRKDCNKKAYSKDKTNYKYSLNVMKQLQEDQLMTTAYYQHLARKNQFMSKSMVETNMNKTFG